MGRAKRAGRYGLRIAKKRLLPRMERNVRLFYVFMFLNRLDLWFAIIQLFFLDRGFSLTQYTVANSVWYLSNLVFEVPTGALSDRLGKRPSMLIALLSLSLSCFILALGRSFATVVASYVLWGFSASFETGTYTAFLYDSLKQLGREGDFRGVMGKVRSLTIVAAALGSVAAGYLGTISLDVPIVVNGSIPLLLCPLVLFFAEPEVSEARAPTYLLHIRESLRYVYRHRLVASLVLYCAIMGAAVWALYSFYQPLLDSLSFTVGSIGLLYALFRLVSTAGAYLSDAIYQAVGELSVYLVPLCLVVSVLCLGCLASPWVVGLIAFNFFISGFYLPVISDLLNQNLSSGKRATIISLSAVLSSLLSAAVDPALGLVADAFSLQATFRIAGLGILVGMSLVLPFLRGERRKSALAL
jgi:MFS family permease